MWNLETRFTGELDIDLSPLGIEEAKKAGIVLKNYDISNVYSSVLKRALHTLEIVRNELNLILPITKSSALNERIYGDLQGLNKAETAKK